MQLKLLLAALTVSLVSTAKLKLTRDDFLLGINDGTLEIIDRLNPSTRVLDLSGLGLQCIGTGGVFDGLHDLTSLSLANNSLDTVPVGAFSALKSLEHLSLANNLIANTKNWFHGLGNLRTLNLSSNPIGEIDDAYFAGLADFVEVRIDGNEANKLSTRMFSGDEQDLPSKGEESNTGKCPKAAVLEVLRSHSLFYQPLHPRPLADRKEIRGKVVCCINDGIVETLEFRTTERLAENCSLATILPLTSQIDLSKLKIRGFKNNWYKLHSDAYFEVLDLYDNDITNVEDVINDLPETIRVVNLNRNKIARIRGNSIYNKHVKTLTLSKNGIEDIEAEAFANTRLRILSLDHNEIENVQFIGNLPSTLIFLDLIGNKISDISSADFTKLNNLQMLYISNNNVAELRNNAFEGLDNLLISYMSDNGMTRIEADAFKGLKCLFQLSLSNNRLSAIDGDVFQHLGSLTELFLEYNNISRIGRGFAKHLTKTTSLVLFGNPLERLQRGSFYGLPMIHDSKIFVDNKIKTIEGGLFKPY